MVADFFENISNLIENNVDRLSYGVAVTDINKDGKFEFVVTGFGTDNLAKLSVPNPVTTNSNLPSLLISVTATP